MPNCSGLGVYKDVFLSWVDGNTFSKRIYMILEYLGIDLVMERLNGNLIFVGTADEMMTKTPTPTPKLFSAILLLLGF